LYYLNKMDTFDERLFLETLKGRFDNIPKDCSRLVRIFLSSTFSGKMTVSFIILNIIN
jgi:hypothetical protein